LWCSPFDTTQHGFHLPCNLAKASTPRIRRDRQDDNIIPLRNGERGSDLENLSSRSEARDKNCYSDLPLQFRAQREILYFHISPILPRHSEANSEEPCISQVQTTKYECDSLKRVILVILDSTFEEVYLPLTTNYRLPSAN